MNAIRGAPHSSHDAFMRCTELDHGFRPDDVSLRGEAAVDFGNSDI
jgi:hypothetical protein